MRILHVTDTYLPRLGGIELHVCDLASRQRAAGHEVRVLTGEPLPPASAADPVPVHRLTCGPVGTGIGVGLGPVLARYRPDVVHAHLTVGSPFTWAVLRNIEGIPAVATLHSLLPGSPGLVRAMMRLIGLPVSRITFTAVSEVAAERLRPALAAGRPVRVLHNGIDPTDWTVPHRPSGEFSILAVGRLAARKRPLVLVRALAELRDEAPELGWSATLVGEGAQRAKVASAVRAHDLEDRVRLPGALSRGEIRALLGRADVLVAPAVLESFGIAALEARCAGVPIVAMASSGVTEFVTDNREGLLVRDDSGIAVALHRLATDRELAARIRNHNRTVPVPMEWGRVLDQHDAVYSEALGSAPLRGKRVRTAAL